MMWKNCVGKRCTWGNMIELTGMIMNIFLHSLLFYVMRIMKDIPLFVLFLIFTASCSIGRRNTMENTMPDFFRVAPSSYKYKALQSLSEINIPENHFGQFFLENSRRTRGSRGELERKYLTYLSEDGTEIEILMILFATAQQAVEGVIAMAKNSPIRFWMPWMINRMTGTGDFYAPGEGADMFTRRNVLVSITVNRPVASPDDGAANTFVHIEAIAEKIDREIVEGELEYIIGNMTFENNYRLIQSLDEIILPEKYTVISSRWPPVRQREFEYFLTGTEFTENHTAYTYTEHETGHRIYIRITLYPTPNDARKSVLFSTLRRGFHRHEMVDSERETIGDIFVRRSSRGVIFSRANVRVNKFSTAINPTHETLPLAQEIDRIITRITEEKGELL